MKDLSEQVAALEELTALYIASTAWSWITETRTYPKDQGTEAVAYAQEASHKQGQWYEQIVAAQRRLIASGFNVPDSWLSVETMGTTPISKAGTQKKPAICVRVMGPDHNALNEIIDQMHIAFIRLTAQSQAAAATIAKRPRVNTQVIELFQSNPDARNWCSRQIGTAIGRSKSQVANCHTYRQLATARGLARLEREERVQTANQSKSDRRQRKRPVRSDE